MNDGDDVTFSKLLEWFSRNGSSAIVALSGGVDSAVVALAAKRALGKNAIAITADYKTLAAEELETARQVAREIGIEHRIIEYDELKNAEFVKNDSLRCYHCRTELGRHLAEEARKAGINLVVDGTNADDLIDYRPGIRALRESGVRSPMVELGLTKSEIRGIAKRFGLSIYDKPSNACLASRIPTGERVTYEKLRRIESAEIIVKTIFAVRQVRVRDHDDLARIEVGRDELHKMFDIDRLALLDRKLKEVGYKFVAVDAEGYKTGKMVMAGK
ncbi:MAG TPA: ATP-dependent sacrificial sulfur transferase LarE [Nitrososphaera sp.]|nr:ATP-dependent sacrificial sulfur transferase LarE [Nitrososphaera sp.]